MWSCCLHQGVICSSHWSVVVKLEVSQKAITDEGGWNEERSFAIQEWFRVESLLLPTESSQLNGSSIWLRCLLNACTGRCFRHIQPGERLKTTWRDYISQLTWECFGIPLQDLEGLDGERKICLGCCPHDLNTDMWRLMDEWKNLSGPTLQWKAALKNGGSDWCLDLGLSQTFLFMT